MAYILGLIATDGNIFDNRSMRLRLQRRDIDILEKIKEELDFGGEISLSYTKSPKNKEEKLPHAELCVYSTPLAKSLEELGIIPNKTLILGRFDCIPEEYELDFIRGVIDGDGSISSSGGERCKTNVQMRIRIFSASLTFVEYLQDIMEKHGYGRPNYEVRKPRKEGYHPVYTLCYSTKASIKFYEENYRDSELHLNRKYDKFTELVNKRKEYENGIENKARLKAKTK